MLGHLAESTARLESLIAQTMVETDPIKYDELCAEIRRVLDERERIGKEPVFDNTTTHSGRNGLFRW